MLLTSASYKRWILTHNEQWQPWSGNVREVERLNGPLGIELQFVFVARRQDDTRAHSSPKQFDVLNFLLFCAVTRRREYSLAITSLLVTAGGISQGTESTHCFMWRITRQTLFLHYWQSSVQHWPFKWGLFLSHIEVPLKWAQNDKIMCWKNFLLIPPGLLFSIQMCSTPEAPDCTWHSTHFSWALLLLGLSRRPPLPQQCELITWLLVLWITPSQTSGTSDDRLLCLNQMQAAWFLSYQGNFFILQYKKKTTENIRRHPTFIPSENLCQRVKTNLKSRSGKDWTRTANVSNTGLN